MEFYFKETVISGINYVEVHLIEKLNFGILLTNGSIDIPGSFTQVDLADLDFQ